MRHGRLSHGQTGHLLVHRTKAGGFEYELVYEIGADDGALRCPGLIDVDALQCAYDAARSGSEATRSATGRAEVGGQPVAGRVEEKPEEQGAARLSEPQPSLAAKTPSYRGNGKNPPYPPAVAVASSL